MKHQNTRYQSWTPMVLVALLLMVSTIPSYGHGHGHAHDHEAEAMVWERRILYSFQPSQIYNLEFCSINAEATMLMALVPMQTSEPTDITNATEQATALTETFSSTKVLHQSIDQNGTVLQWKNESTNVDVLYQVEFTSPCIQATLSLPTAATYMLLTQHGADEISVLVQTSNLAVVAPLQCVDGCEVTPSERSQSWFPPIMASLVISVTSLVGVVILGFDARRVDVLVDYMTSFAAGCLLGVVVFHLYPEGSSYLSTLGGWVMGACVLGGIALSMAVEQGVHMMVSAFGGEGSCHTHHHNHTHGHTMSQDHDESHSNHAIAIDDKEKPQSETTTGFIAHQPSTPNTQYVDDNSVIEPLTFRAKYITSLRRVEPIAWITAVGDFFHAFTDGVVLAVAFKSCSSSLGWAVMFGIVLHEVPHRVGDFFIFLRAGMVVPQALMINFLASLASLLGVIILFAAGAVSDHALGFLLAFGAGALLFIAMAELLPPMMSVREHSKVAWHFFAFTIGCILIGLSTLQEVECEA